jgi:hypothetical protein
MSLKSFLQERGFIEKEEDSQSKPAEPKASVAANSSAPAVEPTYFPLHSGMEGTGPATANASAPDTRTKTGVDEAFVKFFEDELSKVNLPGPDYFEFRKQMAVMHEKIGKKGTPPEVMLQAVLTSFEAQNVSPSSLVDTAKQYKAMLSNKKNEFLKGAASEKDKQFQKRQNALQNHQNNLNQMQAQLLQLQNQARQLQEMINKEQTQMEVDKTMGKEGIEKIDRAEKQIALAHDFIIATIDADIAQLQSS